MLSRVADNLYWMSRYLERAEHTARVIGVHLNLMLEHDPASPDRRWLRVLASLGQPRTPMEGDAFATRRRPTRWIRYVTSIAAARENARQVREQISSEMWEQLNRLFHEVQAHGNAGILGSAAARFPAQRDSKARIWFRASRTPP